MKNQTGIYVMEALPPWCKEVRTPVELVSRDGNRVVLRDLEMAAHGVGYLIETDTASYRPTCAICGECLDETGECPNHP